MARVRYQKQAESDLHSIGEYTLERWGQAQCDTYLRGLETFCERLAEDPHLGRAYRLPYLRLEYISHVVFFRRGRDGSVVVVRVLHKRMLSELHLVPSRDDDPDEDE